MADLNNPAIETFLFVSYMPRNIKVIAHESNVHVERILSHVKLEEVRHVNINQMTPLITETQQKESYAVFGNYDGKPTINSIPQPNASRTEPGVFESVHSTKILLWADYSKALDMIVLADTNEIEVYQGGHHHVIDLLKLPQAVGICSKYGGKIETQSHQRNFRICWSNQLGFINQFGQLVMIDLIQLKNRSSSELQAGDVKCNATSKLGLTEFEVGSKNIFALSESGILHKLRYASDSAKKWRRLGKMTMRDIQPSECFTSLVNIVHTNMLLIASIVGENAISLRLLDAHDLTQKHQTSLQSTYQNSRFNLIHKMMVVKKERINFVLLASAFKTIHLVITTPDHVFPCVTFHPFNQHYFSSMKVIGGEIVCAGMNVVKHFQIRGL